MFLTFAKRFLPRSALSVLLATCCATASGARLMTVAQASGTSPGPDQSGDHFYALNQITPRNVARLQVAWTYETGPGGLQATPLFRHRVRPDHRGQPARPPAVHPRGRAAPRRQRSRRDRLYQFGLCPRRGTDPTRPCYAMAKAGLNALMRHASTRLPFRNSAGRQPVIETSVVSARNARCSA